MRYVHASFLERLSKALHAQYDDIASQPLPQRWVDLIHHLNEKEQRETPETEAAARARRSRAN